MPDFHPLVVPNLTRGLDGIGDDEWVYVRKSVLNNAEKQISNLIDSIDEMAKPKTGTILMQYDPSVRIRRDHITMSTRIAMRLEPISYVTTLSDHPLDRCNADMMEMIGQQIHQRIAKEFTFQLMRAWQGAQRYA